MKTVSSIERGASVVPRAKPVTGSGVLLALNNYYYRRGGAESIFFQHNELLEGRGWQVVPFCMQHEQNERSTWSRHFVQEIEFGHHYGVLDQVKMIPKVVYSFEARKKLAALLHEVDPDICHVHNIYHHMSPAVLGLLRQRGVPTVMTLHDLKIACPAYKMLTHDGICERCKGGHLFNVVKHRCVKGSLALSSLVYLESRLHRLLQTYSKSVDRFVVPSIFFRDKLTEWGIDPTRMVHIPNFIDPSQYEFRTRTSNYFLYLGRLVAEKGVRTLISAAKQASVTVKIAGTGPEENSLRGYAESIGADVEFLGYVSGTRLKGILSDALALVIPSEWYENAPVSVLEAYATGVPVIGSKIGGIPELVRPHETGYMFPAGDHEALSASLRSISQMPPRQLQEMGHAARRLVERQYSSSLYAERMANLYSTVRR